MNFITYNNTLNVLVEKKDVYNWHRPTETVEAFRSDLRDFYHLRPYYYELPVLREDLSHYLDYPFDNDLAVSLVLAKHRDNHYPELMVKQAMWLVKNLCERTDIVWSRTKLVLSLDKKIKKMAMPYLEACRFPLSNVNWFDTDEPNNHYACKFESILSEVFNPFERVMHLDLSITFGNHPAQRELPLFSRIRREWTDHIYAASKALIRERGYNSMLLAPRRHHWSNSPLLAEFVGASVEEDQAYWDTAELVYSIDGLMMGYHRRLLDTPLFRDNIIRINSVSDDEIAMCYYARRCNWQESEIANLSNCFIEKGVNALPHEIYYESLLRFFPHIIHI